MHLSSCYWWDMTLLEISDKSKIFFGFLLVLLQKFFGSCINTCIFLKLNVVKVEL